MRKLFFKVLLRFQFLFPNEYRLYRTNGYKIFLNIQESTMMLARLVGIYEKEKFNYLKNTLKKGDVFIDAGCNKGDFSLLAAGVVGKKGKVVAFEPEKENCRWIRKSIEANKFFQISLMECALSNEDGEATLFLGDKSGWHSLVENAYNTKNKVVIKKRKLDTVLEELNISKVNVMKIDVEGAELDLLKGAENILKQHDLKLFIDLHPHLGVKIEEVYTFLREKGFDIYDYKHPGAKFPHLGVKEIVAIKKQITNLVAM